MTTRDTRSLDPIAEPAVPADHRLFRVGAIDGDTEFYVRCADLAAAADIVLKRAEVKQLPIVYRPIVEVVPTRAARAAHVIRTGTLEVR